MAAQPTVSVKPTEQSGLVVTVELNFQIPFVPADLLAALTTQYGAGKVFANTDTTAKNAYRLTITA